MREPGPADFQAQIGLTHHLGGLDATLELIKRCGLQGGERVLEVGCGVGVTAELLGSSWHCRGYALDRSERMLARAADRLARSGLRHRFHTRRGDIEQLPFEQGQFDCVIGESVTACAVDRGRALREYLRVLKPGGALALNEPTWLRAGPPPEFVDWVRCSQDGLSGALGAAAWGALLADAGFERTAVSPRPTSARLEQRAWFRRYGRHAMLLSLVRHVGLWLRSPEYRRYTRRTPGLGRYPSGLFAYLGYSLCTGSKPQR